MSLHTNKIKLSDGTTGYTYSVDSLDDVNQVPYSTRFYNKSNSLTYYKDANGEIFIAIDSSSTYISGEPSKLNNNTNIVVSGGTWTGVSEKSGFPDVIVSCKTSGSGKLYFEFSNDNENWDAFPPQGFDITANIHEFHSALKGPRFYRVKLVNDSGSDYTYVRLYTYFGVYRQPNAPLNGPVSNDSDSIITRSVLMGQNDGGQFGYVPVTTENHLEVAVHEPLLPFGSIHTENLTPVFQTDAVYGVNSGQVVGRASGSGTATASDSTFVVTTGTTIYSQGALLGRKRLRYRAGQGVVARFTAAFTTPVASSYQVAGVGHAEDGVFIACKNNEFGVLYSRRGVRETRTLTITTASSTTENVTVTLNGVAISRAVTNSGNIQRTVWEISQGTYTGWDAYPSGTTVVFVKQATGAASGSYSISGTTVVGSFAQTKAGAAATETFVVKTDFNGDVLDGTGASGVTIDITKLNIFQLNIGYLGTDNIVFKIKIAPDNGNNSTWITFHTIKLTNALTTTSFGNPAFPFTMAAYSAGSTTDLTVKCGSFAGFIEGKKVLHGNRFTYYNQSTAVTAGAYWALFTVMNIRYYGGRSNQAVINLLNASGAIKHTSPVVYYLIKNGSLTGNPNFQSLASNSCSAWDTAATQVTWSTGDQLVATFHVGDTGEFDHHFGNGDHNAEEVTLQPGEWFTLAARATTGTPAYVTASINTREDQ